MMQHIPRVRLHYITCKGKIPYKNVIAAMAAAETASERYGQKFAHYACHHCGEYHIGRVRG